MSNLKDQIKNLNNHNSKISDNEFEKNKNLSLEFIYLTKSLKEQEKKINKTKRKLNEEKDELTNIKNKIKKVCVHNWEKEPPEYHTRSYWYCANCGAIK